MSKNVTIEDVAKLAGVSKGTVDRVVHNRGEVSKKSAEKVRKAIKELNYEPNLHAALLATKTERTIACIIQSSPKGEYWDKIHSGIVEGGEAVAYLNLRIRDFFFDLNDINSFKEACAKALESNPAGIILAPLFKIESISFVNELQSRNIPYIYIDTKMEDSNCLAYLGMPKYQSGYLCASLLSYNCNPEDIKKVLLVRVIRDKAGQSDPTAERREGFRDYMAQRYPDCIIDSVFIDPSKPETIEPTLSSYIENNPETAHICMLNSRIYLISGFLEKYKKNGRRVVGFDHLDKNLELIRNNYIDFIITEHIEPMSRKAVEIMADFLMRYKRPEERDNYQHMDILTALNLGNY